MLNDCMRACDARAGCVALEARAPFERTACGVSDAPGFAMVEAEGWAVLEAGALAGSATSDSAAPVAPACAPRPSARTTTPPPSTQPTPPRPTS